MAKISIYGNQEQRFKHRLKEFLEENSTCKENKELFKRFFEFEEYKLKRSNGLNKTDEASYKTLNGYVNKLRNVNKWFKNKPLKDITKEDIKKVYDGLEDGKILTSNGKPFKDRKSYYNKVFKSKLFQMIGKADLAREVMEYYMPNSDNEVRFIKEDVVRELANVMINPRHKLLSWLAFDIGENVNSLLSLKKMDCIRQINEQKEPEYRIVLRKEILKRSRTPRTEITNYLETVKFLDYALRDLKDDDFIFNFKYSMAKKLLDRAVGIIGARCNPKGQKVTWKDLRSSMACDLLSKGLSFEDVNMRLGHRPSSREIDKYINYLAVDRKEPKKKVYESSISKLSAELEDTKEREKLQARSFESMKEKLESREKDYLEIKRQIETWKNNIRKELMKEALIMVKREITQK